MHRIRTIEAGVMYSKTDHPVRVARCRKDLCEEKRAIRGKKTWYPSALRRNEYHTLRTWLENQ